MRFSKQLLSIFIDFLFLTIIFSVIILSVFAIKLLFNPTSDATGALVFETEPIPLKFEDALHENDVLYDTLTKRKVGEITEIKRVYIGDRVKFIIKTDASFTPKSESLRTSSLWFKYSLTEDEKN